MKCMTAAAPDLTSHFEICCRERSQSRCKSSSLSVPNLSKASLAFLEASAYKPSESVFPPEPSLPINDNVSNLLFR
jgi:hypothetical protein